MQYNLLPIILASLLITSWPAKKQKKAPTSEGEREVTDRQIKAAFFHGADMTDEEMDAAWEDVMDLRDIVIRKRKRDAGGK